MFHTAAQPCSDKSGKTGSVQKNDFPVDMRASCAMKSMRISFLRQPPSGAVFLFLAEIRAFLLLLTPSVICDYAQIEPVIWVKPGWGWRREGDSNPRGALTPTRFPGVRLKPLGHLSNL